jgi:hypothetical protein
MADFPHCGLRATHWLKPNATAAQNFHQSLTRPAKIA